MPLLPLPIRDMDQIGYLAELKGSTSFKDGIKLLDYGLAREYSKGDELLFRPLTFALVALQNSFYTYHALYWNITSLILHTLNLMILFFLLFTIYPSPFALVFTLAAGTLRSAIPLTVNIHLGGYLVGYALYFLGLILLYRFRRDNFPPRFIFLYVLLTSLGCFFYELIVPFSLLVPLCFDFQKPRQKIFLLLPFFIYTFFYFTRDFSSTSHFFFVDKIDEEVSTHLLEGKNIVSVILDAAVMFHSLFTRIFTWPPYQILIIAAGLVILFWPAISSPSHPLSIKIRAFPAILILIYAVFLGFLRTNIYRDYYPYLFSLIFAVFLYGLFDFSKLNFWKRAFLTGVLIFTIGFNFFYRCKETQADLELFKPMTNYFSQLSNFADSHRAEPDFTFAIQNHDPGIDLPFELKTGYPGSPGPIEFKNMSEIIFSKYYRTSNPKYLLSWDGEQALLKLKEQA